MKVTQQLVADQDDACFSIQTYVSICCCCSACYHSVFKHRIGSCVAGVCVGHLLALALSTYRKILGRLPSCESLVDIILLQRSMVVKHSAQ